MSKLQSGTVDKNVSTIGPLAAHLCHCDTSALFELVTYIATAWTGIEKAWVRFLLDRG